MTKCLPNMSTQTYEDYLYIRRNIEPQWMLDKLNFRMTPQEEMKTFGVSQSLILEKIFEWDETRKQVISEMEDEKKQIHNHLSKFETTQEEYDLAFKINAVQKLYTLAEELLNAEKQITRLITYVEKHEVDNQLTPTQVLQASTKDFTPMLTTGVIHAAGRKKTICPFHQEKTPSFVIYPNNSYYCFGCQEYGDAITFIQKTQNMNFPQAVTYLLNHGI